MDNLTILERNILHAIEAGPCPQSVDEGQNLFLRGADRGVLAAERMAYEWAETIGPFLVPFVTPDVRSFIMERQYRRFFPGN